MKTVSILLSVALLFTSCSAFLGDRDSSHITSTTINPALELYLNAKTTTALPEVGITLVPDINPEEAMSNGELEWEIIDKSFDEWLTPRVIGDCSVEKEARELVRDWNRIDALVMNRYNDTLFYSDDFVIEFLEASIQDLEEVWFSMVSLSDCLPAEESDFFLPIVFAYYHVIKGYEKVEAGMNFDWRHPNGKPTLQESGWQEVNEAYKRALEETCGFPELIKKLPMPKTQDLNC